MIAMWSQFVILLVGALAFQEPPTPPQPKKEPPPPLFTSQPFDKARGDSQSSGRPILLYFSEKGNKQCQSYAEFTWSDAKVRDWVKAYVIPVEADISTNGELARRYNVHTAPTVTIVLTDGRATREIVGFRGPELLLRLLGARMVDAVTAARQVLDRSGGDPAARIGYARALEREQHYAEALEQYLKCVDGPAGGVPSDLGSRLLAVEAFGPLIAAYPQAAEALKQRRDRFRDSVVAGKAASADTSLFAAINAQLGEVDDTMAVYSKLKETAPSGLTTRLLRDGLVDSLIAIHRYDEALSIFEPMKHFSFAMEQEESDERRPVSLGSSDEEMRFRLFLRDKFVEHTIRCYELLLGGGRSEDAAKIAEQMISAHPSAKTYHLLASAALRAGKAGDVSLAHARKALELSHAQPTADVLTTLVRTLQALGRNDEAIAVVRNYADRLPDAEESEALRTLVVEPGMKLEPKPVSEPRS